MRPIHELPPGYREVYHLVLLRPGTVLLVNLLALLPLGAALLLMFGWLTVVLRLRPDISGSTGMSWSLGLVAALVIILPLHEGLHGLAIRWAGHKPRYGLKLDKGALYATADNALFPRNVFIVIALAPLVGITLLGMALMLVLPDRLVYFAAIAVALNAGAAIGDLWMTAVVLRYPSLALVRDEADSLRVYLPE